ncbi:DUF3017 domain-containing protein [Nocardiopsis sp. RSe5-2]|uniref:DUF3017 domain-containing protein n=1 Tax=Nocardiopsis endophytica TaxID=3018445 RepID=A0ABT4UBJ7_9ACTN|nr:DUF3017 domain-containing protein [Nocardiopsis endophytica]MDA2814283.1 DUF3017 domain-containing protein [Nocardiopsis endophytica]
MSRNSVEAAVAAEEEPGPSGHGEDAQGPEPPGWLAQVPYFLVLATMAAGIVVVAAAYFKRGPAIIAGALLLAALLRHVLPEDRVGMLAVRGRWFDIATALALAGALVVLAWVAPALSS